MKIFTQNDYRQMPWKNGGGVTTELFRIDGTTKEFNFRLSVASVDTNGPFSIFPGIDRHLLILSGDGCQLNFGDKTTVLNPDSAPISFRGEESVNCFLLAGSITDFNVMISRDWGTASVQRCSELHQICQTDMQFVLDLHSMELAQLFKGERCEFTKGKYVSIEVIF